MAPRKRVASVWLLGALGALALAEGASAQAALGEWKGGIFRPSTGTWAVQPTPGGVLGINCATPSVPGSVELLLPPVAGSGVPASVEVVLEQLPTSVTSVIPAGGGFSHTFYGTVAGVAEQPLGSLHLVKEIDGRVRYEFDLAPTGATTYTLELWDGTLQVATFTGLPGGSGGGPFFTPNCTCPTCPANWWCCYTGAVYYSNGVWHNAWNCLIPIDIGGSTYSTDRVIVIPENPVGPLGDPTSYELSAVGVPSFGLSDLLLGGYRSIGTNYCVAVPNSTGMSGEIAALGSPSAALNDLELFAFHVPAHQFGLFVVSRFQAFVPNPGGSQGNLCIGQSAGRFNAQISNSGPFGYLRLQVDLTQVPQPSTTVAVQPGETWHFQAWHRDNNPGVTSNFTSGYAITFE